MTVNIPTFVINNMRAKDEFRQLNKVMSIREKQLSKSADAPILMGIKILFCLIGWASLLAVFSAIINMKG